MKVFIGYDPVEHRAAEVARLSLIEHSGGLVPVEYLKQPRLRAAGLYTRAEDWRGQKYDLASQAPISTEFSNSRFLTPILGQRDFCLFMDCDMLVLEDVRTLLAEAQDHEPGKAVYVVKHNHAGTEPSKMCGMAQTQYSRKNWSSVMLFDCDHPANWRLSLWDVNNRPGTWLHQFGWLNDSEIGSLDRRWNQLIGVQEDIRTDRGIQHRTLGGPWFKDWAPQPHDRLWLDAAERYGV